jgi:hypothetical protein
MAITCGLNKQKNIHMKLGIMQPYFMPYLGYISLIKHTDRFILFDTVQFIRHGWIERNRILKQTGGWHYIKVPLKSVHRNTLIKDVVINNDTDWSAKIKAQLQQYKKEAPYYHETMKLIDDIFFEKSDDIVALDQNSLSKICIHLGFAKNIEIFSKMHLDIEQSNAPDEWALNICKAIEGTDEYWNPPGGQTFFDKSKFDNSNIALKFHSITWSDYDQKRAVFEPGLSIIDVLMFNSLKKVNEMLDSYYLT